MKVEIVINKECEEKVVIYTHEKTQLVNEIEELIGNYNVDLIGYADDIAIKLSLGEIYCFLTEDNKVFAMTEKGKYRLKYRLYQIEENLDNNFVKINQSCIANIKKIDQFVSTIGGSLTVVLKNGYKDYVSRRNLKNVKERLGL